MTQEQIKAKAKEYFPNDEFKQQIVIDAINWATEELEKENEELKTEKIPQLERKIASIRGCHKVDLAKLNARIEQVERLKKENAELKEQIAELSKHIVELQNDKGELIDRCRELEAQIEKMKCCGNCTKGNCVNIGQKGKACDYWTSNKLRR